MNNSFILLLMGIFVLLAGGCASPILVPEPTDMVPKMLKQSIPVRSSIYIEKPTLGSAAKEGKAPFDHVTGTFPFVQPQGLTNYQESIRLSLVEAGAQISDEPGKATYILRTAVLGGMTIPFPEAYSILFVRYQLEDPMTRKILWSMNTYSQAKLVMTGSRMGGATAEEPAYGRLVAANLRQAVNSLSTWLAQQHKQTNN